MTLVSDIYKLYDCEHSCHCTVNLNVLFIWNARTFTKPNNRQFYNR